MEQLICYLTPGLLITLLHIFKIFLMEDKYNFFEIIWYYLKATIIINIVMILIVLAIYKTWTWDYDITNSFMIKYIIFGSLFGLFLPAIYYKIKVLRRSKK